MSVAIGTVVNGRHHALEVDPRLTLLEVLRERVFLTGAKEGCGVGECGACVVLLDGEPVASCLVLAPDVSGRTVETIEGLASDEGELTEVQRAFIESGGLQCGFCTPAMVLTVTALLRADPAPDAETMRDALGGVLCRCGAYENILTAIQKACAGAFDDREPLPARLRRAQRRRAGSADPICRAAPHRPTRRSPGRPARGRPI